jgi:hypothetical protein
MIGTFGKPPADLPKDFKDWDSAKKVEQLIQALDEVDARQWGQPGGIDLASDPRVRELITLGDAAVPALIDVVEITPIPPVEAQANGADTTS